MNSIIKFFCSIRNDEALKNFNDAHLFLRGNKVINYYQLGLKAKLYLCEVSCLDFLLYSSQPYAPFLEKPYSLFEVVHRLVVSYSFLSTSLLYLPFFFF